MIGEKIYKPLNSNKEKDYINMAAWCNENNAHIEDSGEYYEVVANTKHTATDKERIGELKKKLYDTDYAIIKIFEGLATKEDYADIIEKRKLWREEIRMLCN